MSSYFIAEIQIHNLNEYQKYLDGFNAIFEKYSGKEIVVDDNPTILEGEWPYSRIVVFRFPNKHEAKQWYESVEYQ